MHSITQADAAESDQWKLALAGGHTSLAAFAVGFRQEAGAVTDRSGVFYGVAGHHDSQYSGTDDRGGAPRCSP